MKEKGSKILLELVSLSAEVVTVSMKSKKSIALTKAKSNVATAKVATPETVTDQVVMAVAMTLMTDTDQVIAAKAVTSEACLSTLAMLFKEKSKTFLTSILLESTSNLEVALTVSTTSKKLTASTT